MVHPSRIEEYSPPSLYHVINHSKPVLPVLFDVAGLSEHFMKNNLWFAFGFECCLDLSDFNKSRLGSRSQQNILEEVSFLFRSFTVGYSVPRQFDIMKDLNITLAEFSVFGSIINFGAMLGAITSGRISDFIGRKGAMRMSSIICIIGWLLIYLSTVPVFIAEITPKHLRRTLATANQLMIVIGISAAFTIGAFVTWRTLALTGIVPCVVQLVGLMFILESPRWLAKVGRQRDFESALQTLRGPDADISEEEADIMEYIQTLDHLLGTVWTAPAHIITTVIGSGILSLPWCVAQLRWIGGPISLLFFSFVTWITFSLLADCYKYPDPVSGI